MSKIVCTIFAICLLAINIVSGQNQSEDKINENKNRINTFIDCYAKHLQEQIDNIPPVISGPSVEIEPSGKIIKIPMSDIYFDNYKKGVQELQTGLKSDILAKRKSCSDLLESFSKKGLTIVEKTRVCLQKAVENSRNEIATKKAAFTSLLTNFLSHKEKAEDCIKPASSDDEKLKCIEKVSKEVSSFMASDINVGYKRIYNLKEELSKDNQSFQNCEDKTGLTEINKQNIAQEINACFAKP